MSNQCTTMTSIGISFSMQCTTKSFRSKWLIISISIHTCYMLSLYMYLFILCVFHYKGLIYFVILSVLQTTVMFFFCFWHCALRLLFVYIWQKWYGPKVLNLYFLMWWQNCGTTLCLVYLWLLVVEIMVNVVNYGSNTVESITIVIAEETKILM